MNIHELPTPCYVIDEKKLKENLEILAGVRDRHGMQDPAGPEGILLFL